MADDHDGVDTNKPRRGLWTLSLRHILVSDLYMVVGIAFIYFMGEGYPRPFIASTYVALLLLSFGARRTMKDLRKQYPEAPALPAKASATRAAAIGAIAMSCGALLPVVVLSLAADWSFFGASLRAGDYAKWLTYVAVTASIVGIPAFFLLRRAVEKSFRERRRIQELDH
jgi:hypothetical protein